MTQLLQKTGGGLAFVYSGVLTASFAVAGLMSLISVVAGKIMSLISTE